LCFDYDYEHEHDLVGERPPSEADR
jgi:hypothetical protein